jgi:hypothetical protein
VYDRGGRSGLFSGASACCAPAAVLQVWMTAGCLPLVAKVADFGLALPLGPTDTHATLHARVRHKQSARELLSAIQHSISRLCWYHHEILA